MMLHSDTNDTTLATSSTTDLDSSPFPYCRRKMRKYCCYDNKHYDDFNSTILYPAESILPLHDSYFQSKDCRSFENSVNARGVKRSNNTLNVAKSLPSTTNVSKLDNIIRRDENRSTYELSKQSELIHESLLHSITESTVDSDTDYDADYDNDGDFEGRGNQYQRNINKNSVDDTTKSHYFHVSSSTDDNRRNRKSMFSTSDDQIHWELQQLEAMEEMEDMETLELIEKLNGMNI